MAKFSALDIANFYIGLSRDLGECIDNLKVNKLLYYAQGWALVETGHPLFNDDIQAWDYGPVVPSVYYCFKPCGSDPIKEVQSAFDESRLTSEEVSLLVDVYNRYGQYTGLKLKEMTHKHGSPWEQKYEKGKNNVIETERIKEYFKNNESLEPFDVSKLNIPIISVAPPEWDSEEDSVYDAV